MSRRLAAFYLVSSLSIAGTISAQEDALPTTITAADSETTPDTSTTETSEAATTPGSPSERTAESEATVPASQKNLRRDPEGVRGLSPFWEEVQKGDAAFIARDWVAAQTFYKAAIKKSPHNPQGHLRMAEFSLNQGELDEAQTFATAALRFSAEDLRAKADASFLISEIREAQNQMQEALVSWRSYKSLGLQLPPNPQTQGKGPQPVRVYLPTADARIAAIETVQKMDAEYAAVRQRIQKGLDEAEKAITGK